MNQVKVKTSELRGKKREDLDKQLNELKTVGIVMSIYKLN